MCRPGTTFSIERIADTSVIHVRSDINDRVMVEQLNLEVHALLEESTNPRMVIDFQGVREVSSAILGVVMGINLKVCRKRGQLRICEVGVELAEIFRLVKLDRILSVDATLQDALAALS
ncbi:MAG: STAS domain-containing protein [Phycisphaeraceae bacterium]|nr:STAS domain-containing protein [Phycisphaeraceae bacterium]